MYYVYHKKIVAIIQQQLFENPAAAASRHFDTVCSSLTNFFFF